MDNLHSDHCTLETVIVDWVNAYTSKEAQEQFCSDCVWNLLINMWVLRSIKYIQLCSFYEYEATLTL